MGCDSGASVERRSVEGGEGHATAGAMVPQNKGNVGEGAAVRNTPSPTDSKTLVARAFEKYQEGPKSLMLSKFPEYKAEEVLNDLQCLLQAQHHMGLLSQEDLKPDLEMIVNIHECECPSMSERVREQDRVCWPCECGTRPAKVERVCALTGTEYIYLGHQPPSSLNPLTPYEIPLAQIFWKRYPR